MKAREYFVADGLEALWELELHEFENDAECHIPTFIERKKTWFQESGEPLTHHEEFALEVAERMVKIMTGRRDLLLNQIANTKITLMEDAAHERKNSKNRND